MSALHYHFPSPPQRVPRARHTDICVYGTSAGGIMAAIEARRCGRLVELVVNGSRLGGLTASGLGNTDIGNKRAIGGLAREFYRRVGAHYNVAEEWRFEPHVAERVFEKWLAEVGIVPLFREYPEAVGWHGGRLTSLRCESGLMIYAKQFIDASYEGDLLGLAGVRHTIGREDNAQFGETLNGVQLHATHQFDHPVDPYKREGDSSSGLLPGINPEPLAPIGSGDRKVQAYNFRLCLTQQASRRPFPKPDGYDPQDYELFARYLRTGWSELFRKFDRIRGQKTDTNNHGAISTDYIGGSWGFPQANWVERERIFQAHVRWQQGLLWFLTHDERVPAKWRTEMAAWGLPEDEFNPTGGWPHQLYIREARRMQGEYIVTERDCRGQTVAADGVGLGAYAMDSHNCQRVMVDGCVRNEGDVQVSGFPPYPISYRAMTPLRADAENLLVPVCLGATHIAYGSIRMEPVLMILGQSAALAAHLAIEQGVSVQDVPYHDLSARLEAAKQIIRWTAQAEEECGQIVYEPEAPPPMETPVRSTTAK